MTPHVPQSLSPTLSDTISLLFSHFLSLFPLQANAHDRLQMIDQHEVSKNKNFNPYARNETAAYPFYGRFRGGLSSVGPHATQILPDRAEKLDKLDKIDLEKIEKIEKIEKVEHVEKPLAASVQSAAPTAVYEDELAEGSSVTGDSEGYSGFEEFSDTLILTTVEADDSSDEQDDRECEGNREKSNNREGIDTGEEGKKGEKGVNEEEGEGAVPLHTRFSTAESPRALNADRFVVWESLGFNRASGDRIVRTFEDVTLTDTSRYVLS